ncbi:glycosyltransferase [Gluconacetobacter sacchari DSM 12717]|nr:glycosyltransferase [Gluconacetobacter sacchari DSM 12717]
MTTSIYIPAPSKLTQAGPEGIRYDYNDGARVHLPVRTGRLWNVTLRDIDTGTIVYQASVEGGTVTSTKKYFVRFSIEVTDLSAEENGRIIFRHDYDTSEEHIVVIQLPVNTLGDVLAWLPYVAKFARTHAAQVACILSPAYIPLFKAEYPEISFYSTAQAIEGQLLDRAYATYNIGLFFTDTGCERQPTDFRLVGLHKTASYILGVDPAEERPRLAIESDARPIKEPYVCIAVQSSAQCKYWNNPTGWHDIVTHLKDLGYRVVCIDQKPVNGGGIVWNHLPHGVEDQTGNRPLAERASWLKHAEFFIGTSSGLAWLAWAAGCDVVMISGFTHPTNEFYTPWRIINWHVCNSCWNDPRHQFDHNDFLWCPRHAGTPRQFECSRFISAEHVIRTIGKLIESRLSDSV